jgi:hypothetical protein
VTAEEEERSPFDDMATCEIERQFLHDPPPCSTGEKVIGRIRAEVQGGRLLCDPCIGMWIRSCLGFL